MEMIYLIGFFLCLLLTSGYCKSYVPTGYLVTLPVPSEYSTDFVGRALLMETSQVAPNFKAALSVEAINGKYSCSFQVFLGDVKVWNSGHLWPFYATQSCVLELTDWGNLQLKDSGERVGWRTGTSKQGVEMLKLLNTGNLVLLDTQKSIKWQSFNYPTDIMLWGQTLDVSTRLTSISTNSTSFFSFEIHHNKIALYLNSGSLKYFYWEFKPANDQNITFVQLGSTGLKLFDINHQKIAQVLSPRGQYLRFLALSNRTGNLGLYHYSAEKGKFEASFQALNTTCDLPLSCQPYGICTFSNVCSCIRFSRHSDCDRGFSGSLCGDNNPVDMVELQSVSSILKGGLRKFNVSKEECASLCIEDCKCVAALYSTGSECFLYGLVGGLKQVDKGSGLSFLVKIPIGFGGDHGKKSSRVRKWLLLMGGLVDGLVILVVLGGFGYYFFVVRRRRKGLLDSEST